MGDDPHIETRGQSQGSEPSGDRPRHEPDDHRIRRRAYQIWIEEGRPDGRATDHWLRAKWELENEPEQTG